MFFRRVANCFSIFVLFKCLQLVLVISNICFNVDYKIVISFYAFSDGEGHVRCEPWSHPDPGTHPHHDWPGELLLPGGCLQSLTVPIRPPNPFH